MKEDVILKYGPEAKMIAITLNTATSRAYSFPTEADHVYQLMFDDITSSGVPFPSRKYDPKHPHIGFEQMCQEFARAKNETQDDQIPSYDFQSNELDPFMEDILTNITPWEAFANSNFIPSTDYVQHFPRPSNPSVRHTANPWNRDDQREADPQHLWGWKASCIHQIPPDHGYFMDDVDLDRIKILLNATDPSLGCAIDYLKFSSLRGKPLIARMEDINRCLAILKTEGSSQGSVFVEKMFGCAGTAKTQIEELQTLRLEVLNEIRESCPSVKFGSHGKPTFIGCDETLRINGRYASTSRFGRKPDRRTECELYPWMSKINIFENYIQEDLPFSLPSEILPPTLNRALDEFELQQGNALFRSIMDTKAGTTVRRTAKFFRAICARIPRLQTKGWKGNEITVVTIPGENWVALCTPSPNTITTGSIILCYKGAHKLPLSLSDGIYHFEDGYWYTVTKPFRLSYSVVAQPDLMMSQFFGSHAIMLSNGVDLRNDNLFNSLHLRQTSSIVGALELVYLMYKSVYSVGSFGLNELTKKLSIVDYRDVRVAHLINNLIVGYPQFVTDVNKNHSYRGAIDPIWNFEHTGSQTFQAVTYHRQTKNDMIFVDEATYLRRFYESELEHQGDYLKSPCGENFTPDQWNVPFHEWTKMIVHGDKWEPQCTHPGIIRRLVSILGIEAKMQPRFSSYTSFVRKDVMSTVSSSRIHILSGIKKFIPTIEDGKALLFDNAQSKYPGLLSIPQPDAMLLRINEIRELSRQHTAMAEDISRVINPKHIDLVADDIPLNIGEVAMADGMQYKGVYVTTMSLKSQKGTAKRCFFLPSIWNISAYRIVESVFESVLETTPDDILTIPGPQKNVTFQQRLKDMPPFQCVSSKDQRRFGDAYLMSSFYAMTLGLLDSHIINKDVCDFMLYWLEKLQHRIILIPWQCVKQYKCFATVRKDTLTAADRKHYDIYNSYLAWFKDVQVPQQYLKVPGLEALVDYPAFMKMVGFILGLLNYGGSLLAVAGTKLKRLLWEKLKLTVAICEFRHSDDGLDVIDAPPPPPDAWKIQNLQVVIQQLAHPKSAVTLTADEIQIHIGMIVYTYPRWILSKLSIILSFICSRLIGCQPSLYKEFYGWNGEMLQQEIRSDGLCVPPLIRWCVALGADLPGLSYATDLSQSVGRVYDILMNRGTSELVSGLLVFANWLIRDKFGIVRKDYHPVSPSPAGGYWYASCYNIKRLGFVANEVRLMEWSESSPLCKKLLQACLKTSHVWKSKQEFKRDKLEAIGDVTQLALGTENDNPLSNCSYIDFTIHFSKLHRTSLARQKMREIIDRRFPLIVTKIKKPTEDYKAFKTRILPYTVAVASSDILKLMSVEHKYSSESMTDVIAKTPSDTRIVAQLGYYKRVIQWPLCHDFMKAIGESLTDTTIENFWDWLVDKLPTLNLPKESERLWDLRQKVLSRAILLSRSETLLGDVTELDGIAEQDESRYYFVEETTGEAGLGLRASAVLALAMDMLKSPNLEESVFAQLQGSVLTDWPLQKAAESIRNLLVELHYDYDTVLANFRSLLRVILPYTKHAIVSLTSAAENKASYYYSFWKWNRRLLAGKLETATVQITEYNLHDSIPRAMLLKYMATYPDPPGEIICRTTTSVVSFPSTLTLVPDLSRRYSVPKMTMWLLEKMSNEHTGVVFAETHDSWWIHHMHHWVSVNKRSDSPTFAYTCTFINMGGDPIDTSDLLGLMMILSYYTQPKRKRFTRVDQLRIVPTGTTKHYLVGGSILVAGHNANFTTLDILELNVTQAPTHDQLFRDHPAGFISPTGYLISPWKISLDNTGVFFSKGLDNLLADLVATNLTDFPYYSDDNNFNEGHFVGAVPIEHAYKTALVVANWISLRVPTTGVQPVMMCAVVSAVEIKFGFPISVILYLMAQQAREESVTTTDGTKLTVEPWDAEIIKPLKLKPVTKTNIHIYYLAHLLQLCREYDLAEKHYVAHLARRFGQQLDTFVGNAVRKLFDSTPYILEYKKPPVRQFNTNLILVLASCTTNLTSITRLYFSSLYHSKDEWVYYLWDRTSVGRGLWTNVLQPALLERGWNWVHPNIME